MNTQKSYKYKYKYVINQSLYIYFFYKKINYIVMIMFLLNHFIEHFARENKSVFDNFNNYVIYLKKNMI